MSAVNNLVGGSQPLNTIPVQPQVVQKSAVSAVKVGSVQNSSASSSNNLGYQQLEDKRRNGEVLSISEQTLLNAIDKANKAVDGVSTYFKFSVHEKTHEIVVKVVNSDTNEVIREIPNEKILDMVAKMWDLAGLFVDEKR